MQKRRIDTNVLVKAAFLTALSIVLTRFLSIMLPIGGAGTIRIGFGSMPIFISGILFGPVVGGITGVSADLIGMLVNPMGAFHLGITFSSFLNGAIPGLFAIYFRKNLKNESYITFSRILIVQIVLGIVNGLILMPIWLIGLYGKATVITSYPFRVINTIISIGLHTVIIFNILKFFKNETRGVR